MQQHQPVQLMLLADPIGLKGVRVLCVNNDSAILDGMEALLGGWGVLVLKARCSSEALAHAAAVDLDAVLADYTSMMGATGSSYCAV